MKETIKNIAILCLSLLAAYLISRVEIFSRVSTYLLEEAVPTVLEEELSLEAQLAGIMPFAMVAVGQESGQLVQVGLQYEPELQAMFGTASQVLKEALGNLSQVEEIGAEAYFSLLTDSPSLYFQWKWEIPFFLLESYLSGGQNDTGDRMISGILLSAWEEGVAVAYESGQRYYVGQVSTVELSRLETLLETMVGEPIFFAFQQEEDYSKLAPLTLLYQHLIEKRSYRGAVVFETALSAVLESLGFQLSANAQYSATDGLVVRGGGDSLRLSDTGQITYLREEQPRYLLGKEGQEISLYEQIEGARRFAMGILEGLDTPPQLHFYQVTEVEGQQLIQFTASLEGVPLAMGDSMVWAEFLVAGEVIESFTLWYRNYTPQEGRLPLLPVAQAQEILSLYSLEKLLLVYQDSGREWVTPTWVAP